MKMIKICFLKKSYLLTVIIFMLVSISCSPPKYANSSDKYLYNYESLKNNVFGISYKTTDYQLFKGGITIINDSTIRYDDKIIELYGIQKNYRDIFYKGIFYPRIITKNSTQIKTQKELDKMDMFDYYQYYLTVKENVTVSITDMIELKRLNPDYKTKRFWFQLYVGSNNAPALCCIELKNEKATKSTAISDFIYGSRLTFYRLYAIKM